MTPLVLVKVDASCDPARAYLLEPEPGEWTLVVHPSLPRERWTPTLVALLAEHEEKLRRGTRPTCARCGMTSGGWDEIANTWFDVRHATDCPDKPKRRVIMPRSSFA